MTKSEAKRFPLEGDTQHCVELGGHCFEIDPIVVDTYPPTYHRVCKHCGYTQHGQRQPDMRWEDA